MNKNRNFFLFSTRVLVFILGTALLSTAAGEDVAQKRGKSASNPGQQNAETVVRSFAQRVIQIIQAGGTNDQFKQAFQQSFHVSAMARAVLPKGLHEAMSAEQKKQFVDLFLSDITEDYFKLMKKSYKNDIVKVTGTKPRGNIISVVTEVVSQDSGRSVDMVFDVIKNKIVRVVFENINLTDEKKTKYQELFRESQKNATQFLTLLQKVIQAKKGAR